MQHLHLPTTLWNEDIFLIWGGRMVHRTESPMIILFCLYLNSLDNPLLVDSPYCFGVLWQTHKITSYGEAFFQFEHQQTLWGSHWILGSAQPLDDVTPNNIDIFLHKHYFCMYYPLMRYVVSDPLRSWDHWYFNYGFILLLIITFSQQICITSECSPNVCVNTEHFYLTIGQLQRWKYVVSFFWMQYFSQYDTFMFKWSNIKNIINNLC